MKITKQDGKILVSDEGKKKAKDDLAKLKGKDVKKLSQAELVALVIALGQMLGAVDADGRVK